MSREEKLKQLKNNCRIGLFLIIIQMCLGGVAIVIQNYILLFVVGICGMITMFSYYISCRCYDNMKKR